MFRKFKYIFISLLIIGALFFAWYSGFKSSFFDSKTSLSQEVIMEQMKNVVKLGTVEGYFSEVYDYKEHFGPELSFFTKKALIRVKAKILAGFDLESIKVVVDEKSRTVTIGNIPDPQIISIEHDIDYYDITEGIFNSFTTEDYNKMNVQAKTYIKNIALKSGLMDNASNQLNSHIELMKLMMRSYGWELKTEKTKIAPHTISKNG
jgi:hypothetical protein